MFKRADWIFSRNPDAAVGVDTSSSDDDGEIARDHPESSEDLSGTSDDLKRAQAGAARASVLRSGGTDITSTAQRILGSFAAVLVPTCTIDTH